jgi:threonine synthase
VCRRCGLIRPLAGRWRCDCGGLLDLAAPQCDPVAGLPDQPWSMWRYGRSMPPLESWTKTTLGEGMTPLIQVEPGVLAKLDQVLPTGSFKDRGAAVLVSLASDLCARTVVADSSGNAGRSVAAYAARAGLPAEIYVPSSTPPAKTAAARASGAEVIVVDGDRAAAATAARARAIDESSFYASHVHQPAFVHGVKTIAYEIWEQLGGSAPGTVVVPAGNGTLVQAMALGFTDLHRAGWIERPPAIVAVQAERCAPLAGLPISDQPTAAAGIAIANPPRCGAVRAAVVSSGGRVVTVPEQELEPAQADLAGKGIAVEITSAAVWAAWRRRQWEPKGPVVVVLTGR